MKLNTETAPAVPKGLKKLPIFRALAPVDSSDQELAALEEKNLQTFRKIVSSADEILKRREFDARQAARIDHQRLASAEMYPDNGESPRPLLIEGVLEGNLVEVIMPTGARWKYTLGDTCAALCTVLVSIDPASPQAAHVFRPGPEGIHPFIGTASRFGVERSVA